MCFCRLLRIISAPCGPRYHWYHVDQVSGGKLCSLPGIRYLEEVTWYLGSLFQILVGNQSAHVMSEQSEHLNTCYMCLTRFMCYPASFLKFSLVEKPGVLRHFSFKSFPPPATTLMCITVLGRLLPVVASCASQKTPVIYIVTARQELRTPTTDQSSEKFSEEKTLVFRLTDLHFTPTADDKSHE